MKDPIKIIENILACPVTHSPLHREQHGEKVFFVAGERKYPVINNVPHMIPTPPPNNLLDQWELWELLQQQGAISYELAPRLNLAAEDDSGTIKFKRFLQIEGLSLDIGCGPQQGLPAYIPNGIDFEYIGMDPLLGHLPREFPFVQGLGEALPFLENSFENIIFHLSLDHMIDFRFALREAHRVLKKNGSVSISTDHIKNGQQKDPSLKWFEIISKGFRQFARGIPRMGLVAMLKYASMIIRLKVPDGANDHFHFHFPTIKELTSELEQLSFINLRKEYFKGQVFLSAIKR